MWEQTEETFTTRPGQTDGPLWNRRTLLKTGLALATTGLGTLLTDQLHAAGAQPATPSIACYWNSATIQAIKTTGASPTVASRAQAIVHTCIYDAWTTYDRRAIPTAAQNLVRLSYNLQDLTKAVSYAAYRALLDLFPTITALTVAQLQALNYDPDDESDDVTTPSGVGNVAAAAVLAYRHHDGSNQLGDLHPGPYSDYTGYVPANTPDIIHNPNRWQPLRVSNGKGGFVIQSYVTPHWGLVKPFALQSSSQFRPNGPYYYGRDAYRKQAQELMSYNALLTDQMKTIADYWADGPHTQTPPGHWGLFCQYISLHGVSQQFQYDPGSDIKMFFILANAIFDAGIACWECKRYYDSARPITAIHYLFTGQQIAGWAGIGKGTAMIDGAQWQPYQEATVVTPAFPEYVSGHSTFSSAGSTILQLSTGNNIFGDSYTAAPYSSQIEPDFAPRIPITLSWATFADAAAQAALSRRYGGIHFQKGDLDGRALGQKVAQVVWRKAQAYINGTITN